MEPAINTAVDSAIVIGFVNAVTLFVPSLDSKYKIGLALIAAVVLTFAPLGPQLGSIITLLFGSSGIYKVVSIVGAVRK